MPGGRLSSRLSNFARSFITLIFAPQSDALSMPQDSTLQTDWVIQTVPEDVWKVIFEIYSHEISRQSSEFIRLSHVCSLWRSIVNNAPELWTDVGLDICFNERKKWTCKPNTELLSLILSRSRTMPLTMSLEGGALTRVHIKSRHLKHLKVFLRATQRAKRLRLNIVLISNLLQSEIDVYDTFKKELLRFPASQLEHLALELFMPDMLVNAVPLLSYFWKAAPLLRSFVSYGNRLLTEDVRALRNARFPFRQLTVLGIEIDVRAFFKLLPLTPSLVSGTFVLAVEEDIIFYKMKCVRLDGLKDLTLITMQDDRDDYWDSEDEDEQEDGEPLMQILEYIVTPHLKTLSLCFWKHSWSFDCFCTFMNETPSPPRIEDFTFDPVGVPEEDQIECLELLPFLQILNVTINHFVKDVDEEDLVGRALFAAMQQRDTETAAFVLCPRLEKVVVSYNALSSAAKTIFPEMVEGRWRDSLEKGRQFEVVVQVGDPGECEPERLPELVPLLVLKRSGLNLRIK